MILTLMHYAHPFDREKNINGLKDNGVLVLYTITTVAIGFLLGADFVAKSLPAQLAKIILFGGK
jgi:hypothetical protein